MVLDGDRDRRMVTEAIPDEALDNTVDLRQQLWHLRRVLRRAFRPRGGDNPTLGIHPDLEFLPVLLQKLSGPASVPSAAAYATRSNS
jgi:hypothetical protein